jgi:hypothetical protein
MKYIKIAVLFSIGSFIMFVSGCNDRETVDFTGNVETFDQVVAQNNVFIEQVAIDRPGWIVVHEDVNGSIGNVISYPAYIGTAGSYINNYVPLDSSAVLTDSMNVIIKLYYDEGTQGVFDAEDVPVEVNNQNVRSEVMLVAPRVTVENQTVENNTVVVNEILTGVRSWIAVYQIDAQGSIGDLVGLEAVNESPLTNFEVQLADTVDYFTGSRLAAILHLNNPPVDVFAFPGNDVPLVFGFDDNNLVFDSFVIQ